MLTVAGEDAFTFGYFGSMMDAATGLLYIGNGQYYDPTTGRFLNGGSQMNNRPVMVDPAGMFLAPLSLLPLILGKKKKRGKWNWLIVALIMCASLGISLTACGGDNGNGIPTQMPSNPPSIPSNSTPATVQPNTPVSGDTPVDLPFIPCDSPLLFGFEFNKFLTYKVSNLLGHSPDYRGLAYALLYVDPHGYYFGVDPILVAAGIAVQSEGYNFLTDKRDSLLFRIPGFSSESSGIGLAQVSDENIIDFMAAVPEFAGGDQAEAEVAVKAMAARIKNGWQIYGENCSAEEKLVIAAIAENGENINDLVGDLRSAPHNGNWESYIKSRNQPLIRKVPGAWLRGTLTGHQYNIQLILKMYINDITELHKLGYELPLGLSADEIDIIKDKYLSY